MQDIKVGDTLFCLSGFAIQSEVVMITERCVVVSIEQDRIPLDKETLCALNEDGSMRDMQFFRSPNEYYENIERMELLKLLRNFFQWSVSSHKCTLEQLSEVAQIVGIIPKP